MRMRERIIDRKVDRHRKMERDRDTQRHIEKVNTYRDYISK